MKLFRKRLVCLDLAPGLVLLLVGALAVQAWTPLPVADDPLVRMPGTQPDQTTLEGPNM